MRAKARIFKMKLDRTISKGVGKYALINLRKLNQETNLLDKNTLIEQIQSNPECIEYGFVNEKDEFFILKLRDYASRQALLAYAMEMLLYDCEFARDIMEMSHRAGSLSRFAHFPD